MLEQAGNSDVIAQMANSERIFMATSFFCRKTASSAYSHEIALQVT